MFTALVAAVVASQMPQLPPLSGWVVYWNPQSLASFEKNAPKLREALAEWVGVDEEGLPFRRPKTAEQKAKTFEIARKHGVKVLGMASNYADPTGFDAVRMSRMLNDPARRSKHVDQLVKIIQGDKLDGLDLDYESMKAADREEFTLFVQELASDLRKARKSLSVTLHPKDREPGNWDGPQSQDYAAIGKVADVVRIMCYDFTWSGSEAPGPIAPDDWVKRVMTFAASQIPARKLELGIAAYGYDWSVKPGRSLVWEDKDWKGSTECPRSGELILGQAHFGGVASAYRKSQLAGPLGLRGLSMWYVGSEDPSLWSRVSAR